MKRLPAVVVLALALAPAAAAQQQPPPAPFRKQQTGDTNKTPLPESKPSKTAIKFRPVTKGGTIKLTAKNQQWVKEDHWRGEGLVDVVYQDVRVQAETIEVNLKTKEVVASGDVILDQGEKRLSGTRLEFNMEKKTGVIYEATANLEGAYFFTGSKVEKLDDTHYRIVDGVFTACEQSVPTWSFKVGEALLHVDNYAYLKKTAFRVKDVPVVWSPYLVWPVKPDRTRGLLIPNVGYNDDRGAYLGMAYFVPFGRSADTTLYADLYERRFLGGGAELRWAPSEGSRGEAQFFAYDDSERADLRWKGKLQHYQEGLPYGFRAVVDYHEYSDFDWFQDFERQFLYNTTRSIYSDAYLARNGPVFSFHVLADRRETLIGNTVIELSQYPQVALRGRPWRLGKTPVYFSLESSATNFQIDRGGVQSGSYARADVFPSISASVSGLPWLALSPKASVRGTYWTKTLSPARELTDETLTRELTYGSLGMVGPSFSRVFGQAGSFSRFKHVIEPRVDYSYISEFDEAQRAPVFDQIDIVPPLHQVRYALVNRLLGKRGEGPVASTSEIVSLEISQTRSLDQDKPLSFSPSLGTDQRSPITALLRVNAGPEFNLTAGTNWDVLYEKLASTNVSGGWSSGRNNLNLTWYRSESLEAFQQPSSQIRMYGGVDIIPKRLHFDAQVNYDIERDLLQQQRYMLGWTGQCFGAYLELRDYDVGGRQDRDFRFAISLKNVGTFLDVQGGLDPLF